MQLTIELPERIARRLVAQKDKLEEIIERGLQQHGEATSAHWREVVEFLARGPRPEEIVEFRPSTAHAERPRVVAENAVENQSAESPLWKTDGADAPPFGTEGRSAISACKPMADDWREVEHVAFNFRGADPSVCTGCHAST